MLRKHRRKNTEGGEAGFTLVELIIVIVLSSLLGVFGFRMLAQTLIAQQNIQSRKEHSDDAVLALDKISRELRLANTIHTATTDKLEFVKFDSVVAAGIYVLYERDAGTDQLLRYEATSTGVPGTDETTAKTAGGSIIAAEVDEFASDTSGNLSLEFDGENARQTSVYVRN